MKYQATDNSLIVKIYDVDKEARTLSKGGIFTGSITKPMMNACQVGEVISVGKNISGVKKKEILLFHHAVEDMTERFIGRDDTGEYRVVQEFMVSGEIYGVVKNNKFGASHIQPKKYYILAEPPNDSYFERTMKGIYQIQVSALNPQDDIARKMGIKVGALIVCDKLSAYSIYVSRKEFFFIFLEDVLAVNIGEHKLNAPHKYVSKDIPAMSREQQVQLN